MFTCLVINDKSMKKWDYLRNKHHCHIKRPELNFILVLEKDMQIPY